MNGKQCGSRSAGLKKPADLDLNSFQKQRFSIQHDMVRKKIGKHLFLYSPQQQIKFNQSNNKVEMKKEIKKILMSRNHAGSKTILFCVDPDHLTSKDDLSGILPVCTVYQEKEGMESLTSSETVSKYRVDHLNFSVRRK